MNDSIKKIFPRLILRDLTEDELEDLYDQAEKDSELSNDLRLEEQLAGYEFKKYSPDAIAYIKSLNADSKASKNRDNLIDQAYGSYKKIEKPDLEKVDYKIKETSDPTSAAYKFRHLLIAASFTILLLATGGYSLIVQNYSNSGLVSSSHQPEGFTDIISTLGDNNATGILAKSKTAFDDKQYNEAITLLNTIPVNTPFFVTAQYNLGILYFQTEQFSKATTAFKVVQESNDIRYIENAEWYLVLTHLKNNDTQLAKSALNSFLQKPHDSVYKARAQHLENELNSFWRKYFI